MPRVIRPVVTPFVAMAFVGVILMSIPFITAIRPMHITGSFLPLERLLMVPMYLENLTPMEIREGGGGGGGGTGVRITDNEGVPIVGAIAMMQYRTSWGYSTDYTTTDENGYAFFSPYSPDTSVPPHIIVGRYDYVWENIQGEWGECVPLVLKRFSIPEPIVDFDMNIVLNSSYGSYTLAGMGRAGGSPDEYGVELWISPYLMIQSGKEKSWITNPSYPIATYHRVSRELKDSTYNIHATIGIPKTWGIGFDETNFLISAVKETETRYRFEVWTQEPSPVRKVSTGILTLGKEVTLEGVILGEEDHTVVATYKMEVRPRVAVTIIPPIEVPPYAKAILSPMFWAGGILFVLGTLGALLYPLKIK